MISNKKANYLV